MIELKNVSKTYKSKKSKSTKALDNVSLTLSDRGMTFILGKSGSGKSTLLNVLGGLDKYDSGDMLILGKSSKDFKAADFDSYRNTYVGFIFQEFNILDDYDVYENIILALQLQQKEVDNKKVDALLEKLELTELKKRKVNELSGGQKQRVAIARALIKDPKIILADEPTGNLDSKTGSGVMDLLKEISKDKLVVIVSHDEEYAKKYGDRIIEIKDGNIINDTNEEKEGNLKNTYKTIKSKLPFKESFKLGVGSLKHKKIKLFFTILLTVATLGFLSCADTLSNYNYSTTHAEYLSDKDEQYIEIEGKHIFKDQWGYVETKSVSLTDEISKKIEDKLGKGYDVYQFTDENSYGREYDVISLLHINDKNIPIDFNAEVVATNEISKILKESITGRTPSASNEIVISNHVANLMIKNGVEVHEVVSKTEFKQTNIFYPKDYNDILNTEYNYHFGDKSKVKIVGIINYDLNKKNMFYSANVLNKIYVTPEFVQEQNKKELNFLKDDLQAKLVLGNTLPVVKDGYSNSTSVAILDHEIEYYDGKVWRKTNALKDNEVILSMYYLTANDENYYTDRENYMNRYMGTYNWDVLENRFITNYINEKNVIGKNFTLGLYYDIYSNDIAKTFSNMKVIGVYNNDIEGSYSGQQYLSKNILETYMQKPMEKVSILYPMTSKKDYKKATDEFPINSELAIKSTYSERLYYEKSNLDALKEIAFYISLVFLVFTVILIANFMFNSISYRKKEIGVLRALGSRSKDVMKIFLWEGIVLSLISGTIASILLVIVSNIMNSFIMAKLGMLTVPFLVGIRQFLVIYIVVFIVTMISSILPIFKTSKMKPIDAILNK